MQSVEERVTRLEAVQDDIRDDLRSHDADIRQLRDWRAEMIGAAREGGRSMAIRFTVAGLTLTSANIAVSHWWH